MLKLKRYTESKGGRQVAGLFSASVLGMPLTILTSVFITRFLGAEKYGDYKFLTSVFEVFKVIFIFGFFQAGSRIIILSNDKKRIREIYGAEVVVLGILFLIMSIALLIYTLLDPNLSDKGLVRYMLILIPFGWTYLMAQYFETLLPASNSIRLLSLERLLPKIGYFATAAILFFLLKNTQLDKLLLVYAGYVFTQIVVYIYMLIKMRISFANLKTRLAEILSFNKSYGFNVYLSSVFSIGFAHLTGVLISYFGMDNSGVGYYSLAVALSTPMLMIPNTVATTQFRNLRDCERIPSKVFKVTVIVSVLSLIGIWLVVPPFVKFFYGSEFTPVIKLNFIVSTGVILTGYADFFNRFMEAKGQSKAIRNSSFIVAVCIMVMNLTLIPIWGEIGASITRFLSGLTYFLSIYIYYRSYLKKVRNTQLR